MRSRAPIGMLLCLALLPAAVACAPAAQPPLPEGNGLATQVAKLNEGQPFDVGRAAEGLYVSLEVEVSKDGIRPLGSSIIRSPGTSNSALTDLQVRIWARDAVISEYYLADPRVVEIEGAGQSILETSTTYVEAPLSADLEMLQILRADLTPEAILPEDWVDLRPWMRRGCLSSDQAEACGAILREVQGVRVVLGGDVAGQEIAGKLFGAAVPWKELSGVFDYDVPISVERSDGTVFEADARTVPYNPDLAQRYLVESELAYAGPLVLYVAQEDEQLGQVARQMARTLSRMKLEVEIKPVPLKTVQEVIAEVTARGDNFVWLTW